MPAPMPSVMRTSRRLPDELGRERELAERRRVGVVGHPHRKPESFGQERAEREVVESEVGRLGDHTLGVDDAGGGDADTEERPFRPVGEITGNVGRQLGEPLP